MPRVTMQDLKERCTALETQNGALQEYVLLSLRCPVPDAIETVIVGDTEHTFKLFGVRRASGGVLLHTMRFESGLSPEVLYFEEACAVWRGCHYHDDAYKIRDAMDRLMCARKIILITDIQTREKAV